MLKEIFLIVPGTPHNMKKVYIRKFNPSTTSRSLFIGNLLYLDFMKAVIKTRGGLNKKYAQELKQCLI